MLRLQRGRKGQPQMDGEAGKKAGYRVAFRLLPCESKRSGRAMLGGRTEFSWGHTRVRACKRLPELRRECEQLSNLGC